MPIVKTEVPMTSRLAEETVQALTQTYPVITAQTIGRSAYDRPIESLVIGTGPRRVLYSAAHHANEWITAPVLLKFAEEYAQAIQDGGRIAGVDANALAQAATIHIVPMVDPDGVDLVTGATEPGTLPYALARGLADNYPDVAFPEGWKANLLGVDLNLQYPAGWLQAREIKFSQGYTRPGPRDYVGRAPLQQLEARALAAYTEEVDPALVLAYHTQGGVIYWQFQDIEVPGARELGEEFARLSGYDLADTPYQSSFAGYKDWFIQQWRRPGYTVEAGRGQNPLPLEQFDGIYRDNLPLLVRAAQG